MQNQSCQCARPEAIFVGSVLAFIAEIQLEGTISEIDQWLVINEVIRNIVALFVQ